MSNPTAVQISGSNPLTNDPSTHGAWIGQRKDPSGNVIVVGAPFNTQSQALLAAQNADNIASQWNG
jgi:hypothetical protein